MAHDQRENYQLELAPATEVTATGNGTGVDIGDYIGTLKIMASVEAVSGTTPTLDLKVQDSPDNSAWTDVTNGAFTQVTTSDAFETLHLDTRAMDQYIRIVDTAGGTSPVYRRAVLAVGRRQTGGQ